jgi:3-phenylpropionate/trans-cinnamate dioxygenase ferredoxin component
MSTRPATPDDVIEGELLGMLVAGRQVVVGRAGGRLYAVDGVCTHQYAALEHGTLEGETVICRFHGSGFDLRSGAVVFPPATKPIESYTVSIEDGRIVIDGVPADVRIGYTGLRDRG